MLFITKPCPNCHANHGYSRWAVSQCSVIKPLRCRQCGKFFHQPGLNVWFWSYFLAPTGIFFIIHWALGVLALVIELLLISLYINRKKPLAKGPKYG